MNEQTKAFMLRRVSWGSIIGGVISALAVSLLMSLLGTAIGFGMTDPMSSDPVGGVGTTFGIWSAISLLVSLATGGFVAGRLAGYAGYIHGFLVWSTSLIIAVILSAMAISGAAHMAGSVIGSAASATGSVLSGAGGLAGGLAHGIGDLTGKIDERFRLSDHLEQQNISSDIRQALQKSGIPALQPDYLDQQLQAAHQDMQKAFEAVRRDPSQFDQASQQFIASLKQRVEGLSQQIDRNAAVQALVKNSQMSQQQAEQTVDQAIERYQQTVNTARNRFNQIEQQVNDVRQQADQLVDQARQQAARATSAIAIAATWSFFGLLIAAIVSALAGKFGARRNLKDV